MSALCRQNAELFSVTAHATSAMLQISKSDPIFVPSTLLCELCLTPYKAIGSASGCRSSVTHSSPLPARVT